jgi:hypothetical protein
MQTVATNDRILTEISSLERLAELQLHISHHEFYQQIGLGHLKAIHKKQELISLGKRLVLLAQHAFDARQKEGLEQISQLLMSLPLPGQFRSIGLYYHSFKLKREGSLDEARTLLENLTGKVPHWYRGRVIMSLAALHFDSGVFESSLPLYLEANRAASADNWQDLYTIAQAQKQIAIFKSLNGDHIGAVAHLENLYTFTLKAGSLYPSAWLDYLNSLAVEFGEIGRIQEAKNICKILLASPPAGAHPEWQETSDDIEMKGYKSRSSVGFTQGRITHRGIKAENVLHLPMPEFMPRSAGSSTGRAKILNYTDWKKRMVKGPSGNEKDGRDVAEVSDRHMLLKIVELASTDDLPDEALCAMVKALERIVKTHNQGQS